jgi:hypothetical protein
MFDELNFSGHDLVFVPDRAYNHEHIIELWRRQDRQA